MPDLARKINPISNTETTTPHNPANALSLIQGATATAKAWGIDPERFYTRQQIEALGICSWITLRRAEKAGKLKVYSYGYRLRRYLGSDILVFMDGGKSKKSTTKK